MFPAHDETGGQFFPFYVEAASGNVPGYSVVHKFGAHVVTTSLEPVTLSGFYRTPATAKSLELVSSSDNDTAAGSGAREVTVTGLGADWKEITQTVVMNGTGAAALGTALTRLYRWYVSSSGTYATQAAGSHAGTLTIRESGAGDTWSTIGLTNGLGRGQSLIGAYTIPLGKTGYVLSADATVDTSKTVDLYFFQRSAASDVASPYSGAIRIVREIVGLNTPWTARTKSPQGPFVGPCDIGFMAVVPTTSADLSVDFEILLVDD